MAAEMILIRIAYAADLPTPTDILKDFNNSSNDPQNSQPTPKRNLDAAQTAKQETFSKKIEAKNNPDLSKTELSKNIIDHVPTNLSDIVSLAEKNREMELRHWLVSDVHLVSFSFGHIKLREKDRALKPLATKLEERLKSWTGKLWKVTLSEDTGNPTLEEQANEKYKKTLKEAEKEPLIRQVVENFPESEIVALKNNTTPE
jgi:DNA polymerase-3 subunit gamma/tau